MSAINFVRISYKQNQQFESDQGRILPTYILISLSGGIYTLEIPSYCLEKGRISNTLMYSLYPQYSQYDFESGQP